MHIHIRSRHTSCDSITYPLHEPLWLDICPTLANWGNCPKQAHAMYIYIYMYIYIFMAQFTSIRTTSGCSALTFHWLLSFSSGNAAFGVVPAWSGAGTF